jgi:hypothetical protein
LRKALNHMEQNAALETAGCHMAIAGCIAASA